MTDKATDPLSIHIAQHGQTVYGDQINVAGNVLGDVILKRLDPDDIRNQRNHAALRHMVRSFWIDGVLKHSLYNELLIRLDMQKRPAAVHNRLWDLILQRPDLPDESLLADTPIIDIFDQMNGCLLILGEPGSGKTTTLLDLADALLTRASQQPLHPTPVIFNLSSWAQRRPALSQWLIDELRTKYSIPKRVAQAWVDKDELIVLLDGLDEVTPTQRDACVTAINHFHQEHLVPLVVCSRVAEYEKLTERLKLQGAIVILPLTSAQVDEYFAANGDKLSAIRIALQQAAEFRDLAQSPLMLSIMSLAYAGDTPAEITLHDQVQPWPQQLWTAYTRRMFVHRGSKPSYPAAQTLRRLRWLASNMLGHSQSIFVVEYVQPSWFSSHKQFWLFHLTSETIIGMLVGSLFGLTSGLYEIFSGTPTEQIFVGVDPRIEPIVELIFGQVVGIILGAILGFCIGILKGLLHRKLLAMNQFPRRLILGLIYIPAFFVFGFPGILAAFYGTSKIAKAQVVQDSALFSWRDALVNTTLAIMKGSLFGGIIGILVGVFIEVIVLLSGSHVSGSFVVTIFNWTMFAFIGGLLWGLRTGLRLNFKHGIAMEFKYSVVYAVTVALLSGGIGGFTWSWTFGLVYGSLVGIIAFLCHSGIDILLHFCVRVVLHISRQLPWNYAGFLDYTAQRLFLRQVGGGYIFVHRLLMEHFASLTDDDIQGITAGLDYADRTHS